jgi:hypothetical protein
VVPQNSRMEFRSRWFASRGIAPHGFRVLRRKDHAID